MTVLTKPIKRELPGTLDRRNWSIELHSWGLTFRAKRTRRSFPITWDQVFNKTMLIAAASDREEKARARKEKRGAK